MTSNKPKTSFKRSVLRGARWFTTALVASGVATTLAGCAPTGTATADPPPAIATQTEALVGVDGNLTVATAGTVLNQYAAVAPGQNFAVGDTSIKVTTIADLARPAGGALPAAPLAAGDLVLVIQMQGASIDATNTNTFGSVLDLKGAGNYELVGVSGVTGNTINLSCALKHAYSGAGHVQVVRVPQLNTLTVSAAGSVVAPAWNGSTGGIVVVHAENTVNLAGSIDVSALGFRGGEADNANSVLGITSYRSDVAAEGGEKGESIAGFHAEYDAATIGGRFGRGSPANGGGGGNAHNAGGGGGANGRRGLTYSGQGVMLDTVAGATAWFVDPAYLANDPDALTDSDGGGRGGYSYSNADLSALSVGPGQAGWAGDNRREVGGIGGHPVDNDPSTRIFLGGGGGAGDGNNSAAGKGGRGGGIAIVFAGTVTGTGSIIANGEAGASAAGSPGDAAGGGGAGGTVIIRTTALSGVTVHADGGVGGNQTLSSSNIETEGPGGGGGGGYIALSGGAAAAATVAGALGGTTNRPALGEFPTNGATAGSPGLTSANGGALLPYCVDTVAPDTRLLTFPAAQTSSTSAQFTFDSPGDATAVFECQLDPASPAAAWATCSSPLNNTALAVGSHTLNVRAVDTVGNKDATPATYTWVIDTAAPDTSITNPPAKLTNVTTANFGLVSTKANSTFECKLDLGAFARCTTPHALTGLLDGTHTLTVQATDPAGNVDPSPAVYSWEIDTTPPDTTIPTHPTAISTTAKNTFGFASTETNSTFECRINTAAFAPCSATYVTADLPDGQYTIDVRAIDAAGNPDPEPAAFAWTIDTGAPDTTIATGPRNPTNLAKGSFTFTSDDAAATFECKLDAAVAYSPCTAAYATPDLAPGSHTLSVRAVDASGNKDATPATQTWVIDTTAPDTTIVSGPPAVTPTLTGSFAFSSDDSTATFECQLDTGAFQSCPATFITPILAVGTHILNVRAVDAAGNQDATPATQSWIITGAPLDTDADGLSDAEEALIGTDPKDADSDDDGVKDGAEPNYKEDKDRDGAISALDPDSDNDGVLDGTELGIATPPVGTEIAKGNFIPDADPTTTTDPQNPDTDFGGIKDGAEDLNRNGRVDTGELDPNDIKDDATSLADTDNDGLLDVAEQILGSNPDDADTDDDGVLDGSEPNPSTDTDGDGLINVLDPDSDNDGLRDGTELGKDCSNPATDVTRGRCRLDGDAGVTVTSPVLADTDHGGVRDGAEDANQNGVQETGELDPTATHGADDATAVDTDGDGLSDAEEAALGSNPKDADSDDDGVLDGLEPDPSIDTDGDGTINVLDADSDGDGLFDGTERGLGCANAATDSAALHCIADADSGATKTNMLIADTDRGSVADGTEDTNHNGKVDSGERDPLLASDDRPSTGAGGTSGTGGAGLGGAAGATGGAADLGGATASGGAAGSSGAATGGAAIGGAEPALPTSGTADGGEPEVTPTTGGDAAAPDSVILGGGFCSNAPVSKNPWGLGLVGLAIAALRGRRKNRR